MGATVPLTADPVTWKTDVLIWVEQWPLTTDKIEAATCLVEGQLQ